ncbi:MAG: hypothetical protein WCF93_03065 [Candidatus Moraniibacteriota bacterium]
MFCRGFAVERGCVLDYFFCKSPRESKPAWNNLKRKKGEIMVGVEGGLMAIIHLVLKRPILGLLGAAGVLAVELGDYPVGSMVTKSFRIVGCEIKSARDGLVAELNEYPAVRTASQSIRSFEYELGSSRDKLLVELNKYKTEEVFSGLARDSENAIDDARKKTLIFLDEKMMFVAKQLNPAEEERSRKMLDVKVKTVQMQNERASRISLSDGNQVAVRFPTEKMKATLLPTDKQKNANQPPSSFMK